MATPSVLVLDLESPMFKFLSWFLAQDGIPTYQANTVDEALKLLSQNAVDVVVVNAAVPTKLVVEVACAVRAVKPEALVVAYEVAPDIAAAPTLLSIPRPTDVDDVILPLLKYFEG